MFIALDLEFMIQNIGFAVDGPYSSVSDALAASKANMPDAAILDVHLRDGEVYPVADFLYAAGIPIIFHSGHADTSHLRGTYPKAEICPKPSDPMALEATMARMIHT